MSLASRLCLIYVLIYVHGCPSHYFRHVDARAGVQSADCLVERIGRVVVEWAGVACGGGVGAGGWCVGLCGRLHSQ